MEDITETIKEVLGENVLVVAYELTPDIQAMLDSGEITRFGSVLKGADTKIFKHLTEIEIPKTNPIAEEQAAVVADSVSESVPIAVEDSANKGLPTAVKWSLVGVGAVVLAGGIYAFVRIFMSKKKKRDLQVKCQKAVDDFNLALGQYLAAVEAGTLNKQMIENLSSKIEIIKSIEGNKNVKVEISIDSLLKLSNFIYEYSMKLAKDNVVKADKLLSLLQTENDSLIKVQHCLKFQRAIFEGKKVA